MLLSSARACGARRCAILSCGTMLGDELRPAAPFYVFGQCAHGFLGDFDAVAAINRGFRDIDGGENFRAATFSLDPKRYCCLHRIFGALEPAALDGLPDKILLLGGEVYLHRVSVCRPALKVKEKQCFQCGSRGVSAIEVLT